ncbi:MAG TPA: PepSY-like domain-containing protein [Salinimicrobium sp.]|nr:PepSY-like domain-containing protein [Salinimicrobium sp.]
MKKVILTGVLTVFFAGMVSAQSSTSKLPQKAQDFISQHFSSEEISKIEEESGWFEWDKNEMYEVYLANGVRVDFSKSGEATEITTRNGEVLPDAVFPANVRSYVEKNYPDARIVSWEKDSDKQEIELSDDREIEFDLNGKFLKED